MHAAASFQFLLRLDFAPRGLLDAAATERLLTRETARSELSGTVCSLALLKILGDDPARDWERQLVRTLLAHLRATDDVGRWHDGRVAVVLPETSPAGARRAISRIREQLVEPSCEVLVEISSAGRDCPPVGRANLHKAAAH